MSLLIGSFTVGVLLKLAQRRYLDTPPLPSTLFKQIQHLRTLVRPLVVAYLLAHIGLLGGSAMAGESIAELVTPSLLSSGLAITIFLVALLTLSHLQIADRQTRISLATHFGSVSVGTFAAAQEYLIRRQIAFEASSAAWLALMEVPSIILGVILLHGRVPSLKRLIENWELVVLLATLSLGYLGGNQLLALLSPVISTPFSTVLCYFLFDMGLDVGKYVVRLAQVSKRLIAFGIGMAVFGSLLGCVVGTLAGLSTGGVALLSTLSASASYVAATAALRRIVSAPVISMTLTVALGITLPWNLLVGIPLYVAMAQLFHHVVLL